MKSGAFTAGALLESDQIDRVMSFVTPDVDGSSQYRVMDAIVSAVSGSAIGEAGVAELRAILSLLAAEGYGPDRVRIDTGIVRGLDYYTGPVFEAQLTFPVKNDAGEAVVFGSVAGGGRYDDLVARFTGQQVPATGISIGVSRLMSALMQRGTLAAAEAPLVFVLAVDDVARSFEMARELRAAGIRAETYVGTKKFGDQLKYADKRGAAIAVIEGSDEIAAGQVTLKDLALGAEMSKTIESRADWVADRPAQKSGAAHRPRRRNPRHAGARGLIRWRPSRTTMPRASRRWKPRPPPFSASSRSHKYVRAEPSVLQPADIFLDRSGEEIRRRTFAFTDPAGNELCLRPDLTIPICRMYVAEGGKIPARLCYNGLAFRHQPAEPERPTQFYQAGVELLGLEDRAAAEIEILTLAVEIDARRRSHRFQP